MTLARPFVRPRFAKASAVVLLLLVPFVAHAVWDYVEARRLRTRLDAIAARGEPLTGRATTIVELSDGAAESERYYRAAAALADGVYDDLPSTMVHRMSAASRDGVWPPDLIAMIRATVDRYGEVLAFADRAAALPFEGFGRGTEYIYQVSKLGTVARLCEWRAIVRAIDGNADAAAHSLYTEARLGRALPRNPPSFRGLAFVLNQAPPSAGARAQLAGALAPLDRDDRLKQEFILTRAMMLDDDRRTRPVAWTSPARTLWTHRLVWMLDLHAALIRAAARPWPDPLPAMPPLGVVSTKGRMMPLDREVLEHVVKGQAAAVKSIRCARLHVSGSLKLVDPFTGRFLALADCKL